MITKEFIEMTFVELRKECNAMCMRFGHETCDGCPFETNEIFCEPAGELENMSIEKLEHIYNVLKTVKY